jgi:2',3'-cyclic-nucleotide 2'-phosphodiesterase (5'-nucleotidase family)
VPTINILHTNDLHNALDERKAERLRALKDETPDCLLLDAGDAIWAGNVFFKPGGEHALRLMSRAGCDAMAMGNREFHFLQSGLRAKIGWADFPVLCANIRPAKPGVTLPVKPWVSKIVAGVRVAIFGLTVPMITERMLSRKISAYMFDDPFEVAAGLVPGLRSGHDLVIALTHIGLKEDLRLAAEVPEVDLIVGGHTHAVIETPEMVGTTAIVQAGWRGRYVGLARLDLDGNTVNVTGSIMEL